MFCLVLVIWFLFIWVFGCILFGGIMSVWMKKMLVVIGFEWEVLVGGWVLKISDMIFCLVWKRRLRWFLIFIELRKCWGVEVFVFDFVWVLVLVFFIVILLFLLRLFFFFLFFGFGFDFILVIFLFLLLVFFLFLLVMVKVLWFFCLVWVIVVLFLELRLCLKILI